jgi:hypothetical protein
MHSQDKRDQPAELQNETKANPPLMMAQKEPAETSRDVNDSTEVVEDVMDGNHVISTQRKQHDRDELRMNLSR